MINRLKAKIAETEREIEQHLVAQLEAVGMYANTARIIRLEGQISAWRWVVEMLEKEEQDCDAAIAKACDWHTGCPGCGSPKWSVSDDDVFTCNDCQFSE